MTPMSSRAAVTLALSAVLSIPSLSAQAPAAPAPAPQTPGGARGQQPPAGRGAYAEAARLPARIMEFTVEPATVAAGQAVTITWAAENPASVSIEPGIGRVAPRGSMRVTPQATSTYTITVNGNGGPLTRSVSVTVTGTTARSVDALSSGDATALPRTADGKVDLTGVYGTAGGGFPAQGAAAANELPRTPTLKPGAESFRVTRAPDDTGQYSSCMPPGVPQTFSVPYYFQITQAPKHVVILHEYLHLFRIIPIDGTPLPEDPDPAWMGHSVGRWEGDTLVVDSIGFNDRTEINGYRHTDALKVTERFRRSDRATMEYEAVIEDPNVFAGPWLFSRRFQLLPQYTKVDEFVCENNRDYKPLFGK